MEVLKFREVDGRPGALLVVEDVGRLAVSPAELMALARLLERESRRRLFDELLTHSTHREWMSARIKRGLRAAKERRQQDK